MSQIETNTTPIPATSRLNRSATFSRDIGLVPAISFALNAVGLALGGILPFAVFAGLFPGVNLLQIVVVALGVSLVFGTIYSAIGGLIPYNGAEYVLMTRIFGGAVGFSISFAMVLFLALSAGAIISMLAKLVAPGLLIGLGLIQGSTAVDLGASISQTGTAVIITTALVALAFALAILPRRLIRLVLAIGTVVTIVAWVWMIINLLGVSGSQFPPAWDQAMGLENFVSRIRAAEEVGLPFFQDPLLGILAGGALSLWLFFGSFSLVNVSGEMKNPGRDLPLSHLVSVLIAGGLMVGTVILLRNMILPTWFSAESYLFLRGGEKLSMPWVFFYSAIFTKFPGFLMVMLFTWLLGFINLLQTIFYYASRIMWAWGKDQVFQEGLSLVHPSWRSPLLATLLFAIVVQVGVIIAMQIPQLFLSRSYIAPLMALMILPLVAVVVAAFKKPRWFTRATGIARWKIGRVPVISILAALGIVYLAVSLVLMANGRLGIMLFTRGDVGLIVLFYIIGFAWYAGRRSWLNRSQVHLDDTFRQMPQE